MTLLIFVTIYGLAGVFLVLVIAAAVRELRKPLKSDDPNLDGLS